MKLVVVQAFSLPCHLVPLRLKYLPHYPIFEHPQPTFSPQCDRRSSTPIQNNRKNYSSVNLDLYIFGQQTGRQKIRLRSLVWTKSVFLGKKYTCSEIFCQLQQFPLKLWEVLTSSRTVERKKERKKERTNERKKERKKEGRKFLFA